MADPMAEMHEIAEKLQGMWGPRKRGGVGGSKDVHQHKQALPNDGCRGRPHSFLTISHRPNNQPSCFSLPSTAAKGYSEELLVPGRHLVRSGLLRKFTTRTSSKRMYFLFNDIVIYASVKGSHYKYKGSIELVTAWVNAAPPDGIEVRCVASVGVGMGAPIGASVAEGLLMGLWVRHLSSQPPLIGPTTRFLGGTTADNV